ncbi:MAG: MFS transporter [Desulfobacterales bacterium]|jgi:sugar phosphate permease|nr:MFS transporter [Desulfobacterales bacterium]
MTNQLSSKHAYYRWAIFAVLASAYLLVYFHRLSLSVVANNLVKEFHTSASVMGLLGSIYFYCYAVMQLPAGLLSDSIGPRKTVTFFLLIAAGGSIIFGISPNIETAFAGRVMVGFGAAMVFIPTMKILSQWFLPREFAIMAGILNAIGGVGVLAATWLLGMMTVAFGWRLSFEIIGGCTVAVVVLSWLIVRDRPRDKGWPSISEMDFQDPGPARQKQEQIPLKAGLHRVMTEKHFWPVAVWFFFDCGIFFGFGALWSGPYLMHVYGMTHHETGAILSMIAWGMILGSPAIGVLSDRLFKSRKKPFMLCALVLSLELLILYLFPDGFSKPALYLIFFLFSVCSSAIVIMAFTTTKELFPVQIAGTSVGAVNLFPFLGGAVFMPLLGRILDAFPRISDGGYPLEGYQTMFLVLLLSSIACLICAFLMKETFHQ